MLSTNTQQTQAHQTHQFRAMGCQIRFWLATPYTAVSQAKIVQAEQLFRRTENQLSRFLPDSELSRFNRQSGQWVAVSPLFWAIIVAAVQAAAVTGGYSTRLWRTRLSTPDTTALLPIWPRKTGFFRRPQNPQKP